MDCFAENQKPPDSPGGGFDHFPFAQGPFHGLRGRRFSADRVGALTGGTRPYHLAVMGVAPSWQFPTVVTWHYRQCGSSVTQVAAGLGETVP